MFNLFKKKQKLCPYCFEYFRAEAAVGQQCPHCKKKLKLGFLDNESLTFAIIGAKDVGKTHYFSALVYLLRKKIGPELNILLELADDNSINKYKNYMKRIEDDKLVISETLAGANDPILFFLTFSGADRKKNMKAVSVSFFDTAGEDLNTETAMQKTNRYIARSDGLLLLMDPLQLNPVRKKLGFEWLPPKEEDNANILNRVTSLVNELSGESDLTKKIPVPIAVAFNKFDALSNIIASDSNPLTYNPDHSRGFDVGDFEAMSSDMRALLHNWDCGEITQIAETRYKARGFFAVSALGCNPHAENGEVTNFAPKRVADPFLWLLYYHGLIKASPQA
jgi:hypothetical protein